MGFRKGCLYSRAAVSVQGGRKVVCGDGEGVLMIYTWGLWGDITDRYPSQPHSIDCMVRVSDSVVCAGSMDGAIRYLENGRTSS